MGEQETVPSRERASSSVFSVSATAPSHTTPKTTANTGSGFGFWDESNTAWAAALSG
jgi:hypothetical protein